ncbi:MAG: outer membrane lipoprotein-sorting protein [Spirochaetes bacterium]|nr:outer membrane lipoprotein-sorting protein [Spirochaetota bacterium]
MRQSTSHFASKAGTLLLLFFTIAGVKAQGGPERGGGFPGMMGSTATTTPKPSDIKQYSATDFLSLIRQTDIRSSFYDSDMTATINMVMVSPDRGTQTRKQVIYRRDKDNAFLMMTVEPESRKGQGLLLVDQNMWRYDPTSRKYTHTDLKETYENSTVRNADFKRFQRAMDYSVSTVDSGTLGKYPVWIAELKANNDEVPFPYIKIWLEKDRQIVLKQEEYSLSKKLLRTTYYTNYVQIGKSYVPTVQISQDGLIPEKRSQMTYTNISTKAIPNDVFTKNYLERMSQ